MAQTEHAGEDASLDAAVAAITAKMHAPAATDARANQRGDVNEYDGPTDLEELEDREAGARVEQRQPAQTRAEGDEPNADEPDPAAAKEGADASEGEADGAGYLELPPETEGAEPERIPLAKAIEAIKAQRQIDGDIANVINAAEVKYQQEQDQIIGALEQMHDVVLQNAEAALRLMPRPQRPSELLLDEASQYYNPAEYHRQQLNYEKQVGVLQTIAAERDKAVKAKEAIKTVAQQQLDDREHERLSRVKGWEDWKDPTKREARSVELMTEVEKHFGIPRDLMDKYPFHHGIMQMVKAALDAKRAPAVAVEVKKQVQEKTAKIVNGRLPDRDRASGRFTSEFKQAADDLKRTGSEDAFARKLIASGALKNLR